MLGNLTNVAAAPAPVKLSTYFATREALENLNEYELSIDLGARKEHVRVWLDPESSPCAIRLDAEIDADNVDATPRLTELDAPYARCVENGVQHIYIYATDTAGAVNVEAW